MEEQYRLKTRQWLKDNIDPLRERKAFSTLHWMPSKETEKTHHNACQKLQMKLYEAGFAGTTVPTEYGGHGGEAWMQKIFREESTGYQVHTGFYLSLIHI